MKRIAAALVAALGMIACGGERAPQPVATGDLNVVLVVLDAGGARHFGAYGNPLSTSDAVDALARDGVLFERAYAQAPWTLPSTASLLTGRYPSPRRQKHVRVDGATLATLLHDAGLRTAAFSENPYVTREFGFARGFDVFEEFFPAEVFAKHETSYPRVASEHTVDEAIQWIRAGGTGRFFLYLHLLTPHAPYAPPAPFRDRFDAGYPGAIDGSIGTLLRIDAGELAVGPRDLEHLKLLYEENLAHADHQVGRLVSALATDGLLERTIVVVTADHGEAFREHGRMLHTTTLYEEMVHVPLVMRFPSRFGRLPGRWGGVVELRDVVPTLCDALGVGRGGRSLIRRVRTPPDPRAVARSWTDDGRSTLATLVTQRRKLVMDRRRHAVELFELADDPGEAHDVAREHRDVVTRLARRLRAAERPLSGKGETADARVAPATVERLRALGYAR